MKTTPSILLIAALCLAGLSLAGCSNGGDGGGDVNLSAQVEQLKNSDSIARQDACIAIATLGPDALSAVPALIPLLKDGDADVRRLAAYAIFEIGPKATEAAAPLKEMIRKERNQAAQHLAVIALREVDSSSSELKIGNRTN